MKVLVVYCHPSPRSFVAQLKDDVCSALEQAGHEVSLLDLYAEGFSPTLGLQEWDAYESGAIPADLQTYVEQLRRADALALVYPTWWYGLPAMLKGYFDRIWLPGVAFGLAFDGTVITHELANIRALFVVTTYGAPAIFIRLFMGDPGQRMLRRGLPRLFARGCRTTWCAMYGLDGSRPEQRERFRTRTRRAAVAALNFRGLRRPGTAARTGQAPGARG